MMCCSRVLVALFALVAGPALADEAAAPKPILDSGKAVAEKACRGCHLISPGDRGPVTEGVPSFTALANAPGQSESRLLTAIQKQHPVMPQPPVSRQQAKDVVAYILSLKE